MFYNFEVFWYLMGEIKSGILASVADRGGARAPLILAKKNNNKIMKKRRRKKSRQGK